MPTFVLKFVVFGAAPTVYVLNYTYFFYSKKYLHFFLVF